MRVFAYALRPYDELLAGSDVVALYAPGLPENHHLISARELSLMRSDALLVNAARGDDTPTRCARAAAERLCQALLGVT